MPEHIGRLQKELKEARSENESLKSKAARDALGDIMNKVQDVDGVKVLASALENVNMNELRSLGDELKQKLGDGVILLASGENGKVSLMCMAGDEAQKRGAQAGKIIKAAAAIVGGGGGGRHNMAQAGGKNPEKIPEMIQKVPGIVAEMIR